MPLIHQSSYPGPPRWQFNGHLQTIWPSVRKISPPSYERERITLADGDFLDLDWLEGKTKKLAILTHGLEGNSHKPYMVRMAAFLFEQGWSVLAWNCRSCSGEMNRAARMYHHGDTEDIEEILSHALSTKHYEQIDLIGFSMGGSILSKYLGVKGKEVPDEVRCGIAWSTPFDLKIGIEALETLDNWLYKNRFYNSLKKKIHQKADQYPDLINPDDFKKVKKWEDFDRFFSAPINGFQDQHEFYRQASLKHYVSGVRKPLLVVNALNDPILPAHQNPVKICEHHDSVFLEQPKKGGHVGFDLTNASYTWIESRTLEFLQNLPTHS
jgi:predicted alpha/beta-fold hydrolase